VIEYYDHYHDPNTHLRLTRQAEHEFLQAARRRELRPGLLARLRTLLRGAVPARPASEDVTFVSGADATKPYSSHGHRGTRAASSSTR
jgi:hypothetical protein